MSGLPGRSRRCRRYLYSRSLRARRTTSSGFVSRDLMRDIFQLRRFAESLSAMDNNLRENSDSQLHRGSKGIYTSITTFRFTNVEVVLPQQMFDYSAQNVICRME